MQYKKRITKDEIATLPLVKFDGEITIIDSGESAKRAIHQLSKESFVGFDTETKPVFKKGGTANVSLIQLATKNQAYLFRINMFKMGEEFIEFLSSAKCKKIGVAVKDDLIALKKVTHFTPKGFIDLADISRKLNIKTLGLRSLGAIFLGKRISKNAKLTNWENKILTEIQTIYAATDAWAPLEIYQLLNDEKLL